MELQDLARLNALGYRVTRQRRLVLEASAPILVSECG